MQGAAFSLRLVVIVGFGVEIALIADLDLGDERKRDGDRDLQLALMGQLGDLPIEVEAKAAVGKPPSGRQAGPRSRSRCSG